MRLDRALLRDRLLQIFAREPSTPLTCAQLAVRLNTSPDAIRVTLHGLLRHGLVEQCPAPAWEPGRTRAYRTPPLHPLSAR